MTSDAPRPTDRRALLAGIGGLAAGTFLSVSRAEAGPLTPPGAPSPTGKPLSEIEPRVAVNDDNTPTDGFAMHLISQPGSYYLTSNIAVGGEQAGVLIDASNVTLDLNGFSIIGKDATSSAAGVAVASERTDVMIHNGFIAECRTAVYGEESPGRVVVRNVHVRNTQFEAIFLSNQCIVEDCTVINGGGIVVWEDSRVSRCLVQGGAYFGIGAGPRSVVESCKVSGTTQEGISAREGCVVEGNIVQACGSGIRVPVGGDSVIRGNTVLGNTATGLRVDAAGNTVSGNTVRGNGTNYQFAAGNQLELLISQIPQVLSWPCVATLQGRLNAVVAGQNGITISSENVTLDLAGHELRGGGNAPSSGVAVLGAFELVVVRNGSVSGWMSHGVDLNDSYGSTIEDIVASSCGQFGIRSGMASRVQRCRVQACQNGIRAREKATVTDCRVDSCEQGGIELAGSAVAERNDLRSNEGPAIHAVGSGSIVRENIVVDGFGTGLKASAGGNTFSGNTVRANVVNYDFVAANQLELLISQIPQTLSWPCKATVTGTLTGVVNQHGITITSDNVAIDLGGHTLVGGGGTEFRSGISVESGATRKNIMVRNGTLSGWRSAGLYAPNAASLMVEDVVAVGNFVTGFDLGQSYVTMTRCAAHGPSSVGISGAAGGGTFVQCSANQCGTGFSLSGDCTVQDCKATANSGVGIGLFDSGTVTNSTASYNGDSGFRGTNAVFTACISRNNQTGFQLIGGSVSGCYAFANTRRGVSAHGALVVGNNVSANGVSSNDNFSAGIFAQSGSRIEGNDCRGNRRGIKADYPPVADCIIIRNTCRGNTLNWEIPFGNAVAPIVQATTNPADISGNTYGGNLGSTDPNANFTH